jgi:hypothetical protein
VWCVGEGVTAPWKRPSVSLLLAGGLVMPVIQAEVMEGWTCLVWMLVI